jgi:hypothetical protein
VSESEAKRQLSRPFPAVLSKAISDGVYSCFFNERTERTEGKVEFVIAPAVRREVLDFDRTLRVFRDSENDVLVETEKYSLHLLGANGEFSSGIVGYTHSC